MNRAINSVPAPERDRFCAQGYYRVYNADDNWRTALMAGALSLVHYIRPLARERWRTSVGLKGNGMCFSAALFDTLSWSGGSITEDLDYGLDLIEHVGARVRFVPDAIVEAQMPTGAAAAASQRRRWEGGRKQTVRLRGHRLLRDGLLMRDRVRLDAALDLLCPALAHQAAGFALWLVLVVLAAYMRVPLWPVWCVVWAAGAVGLIAYVLGGFKVADAPLSAYRALGMAIFYVPWKIATVCAGGAPTKWQRTERQTVEPAAGAAAPVKSGSASDAP